MRSRRTLAWTSLALAVLVGLLLLLVQRPRTTNVQIVFRPRVPTELSLKGSSVTLRPSRGLPVVPTGGVVDPRGWKDLIAWKTVEGVPGRVVPDGVEIRISNSWLSLGARRAVRAEIPFLGRVEPRATVGLSLNVELLGEGRYGDRTSCPSADTGSIRLRRSWTDVRLFETLDVPAGCAERILIDTSVLPYVVPAQAWRDYSSSTVSNLDLADSARLFEDVEIPPKGADLPYVIEDEVSGAPYPAPETLTMNAKVIDARQVVELPTNCKSWNSQLDKTCWRRLQGLAPGSCTRAWPVSVDAKQSKLHIEFAGPRGLGCKLLFSAEPPDGDSSNVLAFDLRPPAER
jgi:hypothetical protein